MSGIRETKKYKPKPKDLDPNGYLLGYMGEGSGYSPGWKRVGLSSFNNHMEHYQYWVPLADIALLPFHKE